MMNGAKSYRLQNFPPPILLSDPFRDNIRKFLEQFSDLQEYEIKEMRMWCTVLIHEHHRLPLYVFEERVKNSPQPFCLHCQYSGFSHNFVSMIKYHFVIPIDHEENKFVEDAFLNLQTHILHGLIHCNGYGHLLCINGIEGGSHFISGTEIMGVWDRICNTLQARNVTLYDTSQKRKMELKLLYGLAYGQTWFQRNWNYNFSKGSYGVTKEKYEEALQILSTSELDNIFKDSKYKRIISRYRNLARNQPDTKLVAVRDLFRFMLTLKFSLERVANLAVNVLKEYKSKNGKGMSRKELWNAVRKEERNTDLIDYVLKSMNNVIVGGYEVRRAVNSRSRVHEYSLVETPEDSIQEPKKIDQVDSMIPRYNTVSGSNVYKDLTDLYCHLTSDSDPDSDSDSDSDSDVVRLALSVISNSKLFIKEWPLRDDVDNFDDLVLRFICRVIPSPTTELELETGRNKRKSSVGEVLVVPYNATIHDLKAAAETAMRDTYCLMEKLEVTEIVELEESNDEELIISTKLQSGSGITVLGSGVDWLTPSDTNYEGGADNWMVICTCGARDDDGERMVACDDCGVWQHTLCYGIDDSDDVQWRFVCPKCMRPDDPHQLDAMHSHDDEVREVDPSDIHTRAPRSTQRQENFSIWSKSPWVQMKEKGDTYVCPPPLDNFMNDDISTLYEKHDNSLLFVHPYIICQMSMDFWSIIYGDSHSGWFDTDHIMLWVSLILERRHRDARWTVLPTGFSTTIKDWREIVDGTYYPPWSACDTVYIPINGDNRHWFLGVLDLPSCTLMIYDSSWDSGFFSDTADWFTDMRAYIHTVLLTTPHWGSQASVAVPLESFRLTLVQASDVPQQSGPLGDCGVFLCWFLEMLTSGRSLSIDGCTATWANTYRRRFAKIAWGTRG